MAGDDLSLSLVLESCRKSSQVRCRSHSGSIEYLQFRSISLGTSRTEKGRMTACASLE